MVKVTARPLYPRKRHGTNCAGSWVAPRPRMGRCGKSRAHRDSIHGLFNPWQVAIPTELSRRTYLLGSRCEEIYDVGSLAQQIHCTAYIIQLHIIQHTATHHTSYSYTSYIIYHKSYTVKSQFKRVCNIKFFITSSTSLFVSNVSFIT